MKTSDSVKRGDKASPERADAVTPGEPRREHLKVRTAIQAGHVVENPLYADPNA